MGDNAKDRQGLNVPGRTRLPARFRRTRFQIVFMNGLATAVANDFINHSCHSSIRAIRDLFLFSQHDYVWSFWKNSINPFPGSLETTVYTATPEIIPTVL